MLFKIEILFNLCELAFILIKDNALAILVTFLYHKIHNYEF